MCDITRHTRNKKTVQQKLQALCGPNDNTLARVTELYADDARVHAWHPVDELAGHQQIASELWQPLLTALPDLERRNTILIAGEFDGKDIVATLGHLQGTFETSLYDIPPTQGIVYVRYGEVHHIADGRIAESWVIADMLDLMRQAGCWPLAPSLGAEHPWPGPAGKGGVEPDTVDPEGGATALALVKRMHAGLLKFDGHDIESMDHQQYWTGNFLWYGPSGIGSTRGLTGFRAHHQIPFLRAFPDRTVSHRFASTGDGHYVVTGGWPSVIATHTGGDWLGLPPTGKRVGMRVMDFYRCEDGLIAENWVPIDIIDILRQLGIDVFGRMRHRNGRPRMTL